VFDEVQCGVGRTSELYAYQYYGVTPDILTTAKALGNGFPISAMLTRSEIAASLTTGTHGTTYGGNPLACAVAKRVLELVNTDQILDSVAERHVILREWLIGMKERYGFFSDVRGLGLLMGAELAEPWSEQAKTFMSEALKAGVMVLLAGGTVLRFAPPLNIPWRTLRKRCTSWKTPGQPSPEACCWAFLAWRLASMVSAASAPTWASPRSRARRICFSRSANRAFCSSVSES